MYFNVSLSYHCHVSKVIPKARSNYFMHIQVPSGNAIRSWYTNHLSLKGEEPFPMYILITPPLFIYFTARYGS